MSDLPSLEKEQVSHVVADASLAGSEREKRRPNRSQDERPSIWRMSQWLRAKIEAVRRAIVEETQHGRQFLLIPVYMGTGSIVWFTAREDPAPTAVSLSGAAVLLLAVALPRHLQMARHVVFAIMFFLFGMLSAQLETWRADTIILDKPVTTTMTGRVAEREVDDMGRWRYTLDIIATANPVIHRQPTRVRAVALRAGGEAVAIGAVISGRARLSPPSGPALPGLHDFAFSSFFDGVGANGFFFGRPHQVPDVGPPSGAIQRIAMNLAVLRASIGDRIRHILPGDTGAFAASLVNDQKRAISQETIEALRVSGLAHIIAISGLNMALSAGILFIGFRKAISLLPAISQLLPVKKLAAVFALVNLTAYYLISGFGVSAERAYIMMTIMLGAVLFDRPSISLRNIALAALVTLVMSPSNILGPSFQMSYAATLALVSGYRLWQRKKGSQKNFWLSKMPWPLPPLTRFFLAIFVTSFLGGVSTAIFSIEHFHRLATYGLVANLVSEPVVSFLVMPAGVLAMLLMPFGLDWLIWPLAGWGIDLVIAIAKYVGSWGGSLSFSTLPVWLTPAVSAGFVVMMILRTPLRHLGAVVILASVCIAGLTSTGQRAALFISEDGQLAALRGDGLLEPNRLKPPKFLFQQWQEASASIEAGVPLLLPDERNPEIYVKKRQARLSAAELRQVQLSMEDALDARPEGGFACHRTDWCVTLLGNGDIFAWAQARYIGPACNIADIVATPANLKFDRCFSGARLFTAGSLRKSGAVTIDAIDLPLRIVPAIAYGRRPWSRHRFYDWRKDSYDDPSPALDATDNAG